MSSIATKLVWGLAAILVVAGAYFWGVPYFMGPLVTPVVVVRQEVVQTVVASGKVETTTLVNLGTQVTGTVSLIFVSEGDKVHADQSLLSLADGDARAALDQAKAGVAQAQAKLNLLSTVTLPAAEQTLSQAKITMDNAKKQFERIQHLALQDYSSQSALDDARKAQIIASAQVQAAELAVNSSSPGGSDVIYATAVLNQAKAALASAQMKIDFTTIKSPADGIIMANNADIGMVAQPGIALMVLAPTGQRRIVLQIDERNLSLIKLGQPALVSADAYPDRSFDGLVSFIKPSVDADSGSFEVRLDVPEPPEYMKEGMTVSVDIEVARRKDALVLPLTAIRDAATAKPYVLIVKDGRAANLPVTLGARGPATTEILSGVKEGDPIIPVTQTGIVSGNKVRTKAAAVSP